MSEDALRKLALQVRNWGRWGPDDEIGTLNFITPDTIARASRLVTAGKVFALGIPLQREGPQSGTRQRFTLQPDAARGIVAEVRLPFHVGVSVELPIPVLERLAESTLAEAQRV